MHSRVDPRLDEPIADWVLHALALARVTGAPMLACLAGVRAAPDPGGRFVLGLGPPPAPQRVGIVELAMLADLALGGALRTQVGPDRPLPTLQLGVELAAPVTAAGAEITARADAIALAEDGVATASATLGTERGVLGHCVATFAVPPRGHQDPLPWEVATVPPSPLAVDELTGIEYAVLRSILGEDGRASFADRLVSAALEPSGRLTPTEAMTNRSGAVQGGVLFGLAALRGAGDSGAHLVSGSMRFLSAADAALPVSIETVTEHTTRRTMFVRAELSQRGRLRAVAGLVLRREPPPAGGDHHEAV